MKRTIKRRLVASIGILVLITVSVGLIGVYKIIDRNEEEYIKGVKKVKDYIKNGDIYI